MHALRLGKIWTKRTSRRFFKKGLIYMNPLLHFQKLKDDTGRGDIHEGVSHVFPADQIQIAVNGKKIMGLKGTVRIYEENATHLFSLASVSADEKPRSDGKIFDDKIKNLSGIDSLLIIHDTGAFYQMLLEKLNEIKNSQIISHFSSLGKVSYVHQDSQRYQKMGIFKKFDDYIYQEEIRFTITNTNKANEPFVFDIGSLENIAILQNLKDFKNQVDIKNGIDLLF